MTYRPVPEGYGLFCIFIGIMTKTMTWWQRLFARNAGFNQVIEVSPLVEVGERYILSPTDGDPFEPCKYRPVKVTEVKSGWVRYDMEPKFPDCRKPIKDFVSIYRKVQ